MAWFGHIDDEFDFGKFKGLSLSDVMDISPQYIEWCVFNVSNLLFVISDEAMEELSTIYPTYSFGDVFEQRRQEVVEEWKIKEEKEDKKYGCYYNNIEMYEDRYNT